MRFFFDNNIAPVIARSLHELSKDDGHRVVHLREKFAVDTPDIIWIGSLATEKWWTVVSGDIQMSRKKHEAKAWQDSGLTVFFLAKGWNNLKFWDKAWRIVRWWPSIIEYVEADNKGAFIVSSNFNGKFTRINL